jgi:hypothetical protein
MEENYGKGEEKEGEGEGYRKENKGKMSSYCIKYSTSKKEKIKVKFLEE